jgi:DNA-directed RNA polymerase specialized sigma24 family protein
MHCNRAAAQGVNVSSMATDEREFLDFFADQYWPLRQVGFLLTGDWHEADELAQEAMARTYAVWGRVRQRERAAAYARKVLVNRYRSLARRARVEARHPCHLRTTLRLTGDGVDVPRYATMWFWGWDNWCRQPLPDARVRVTADSGASTTRPLPPRSIQDARFPCHPNAPWKVAPLP